MAADSVQLPVLGYAPEDFPKMTNGVISRTRVFEDLGLGRLRASRQARLDHTRRGAPIHRKLPGSSRAGPHTGQHAGRRLNARACFHHPTKPRRDATRRRGHEVIGILQR
jgi:hypothetical protein